MKKPILNQVTEGLTIEETIDSLSGIGNELGEIRKENSINKCFF